MNTLVERLGDNFSSLVSTPSTGPSSHPALPGDGSVNVLSSDPRSKRHENSQSTTSHPAPVYLIRDVAIEVGMGQKDNGTKKSRHDEMPHDIIDNGLLELNEASSLLVLFVSLLHLIPWLIKIRFREHYGRWVVFNEYTSPGTLLEETRQSPLLLCACCLIAVRHATEESASRLAPLLFNEAKSLLSTALLVVPQSIAFFQSALILSLWSTTIGQVPLSVDSWLLSGFALQHSLSSDLFAPITTTTSSASLTRDELNRWFIWNHLCLVHLQ